MLCSSSPFTLYKPYLVLMFKVRQCALLKSQCSDGVLERDMRRYKLQYQDLPAVEREGGALRHAMRHALRLALRHAMPRSIPGSPAGTATRPA